jgi:hypothetical protein
MSPPGGTLRPMAAALIARCGASMILRRATTSSYDPATGVVTDLRAEHAVDGVIEGVETTQPDGVVRRGDQLVTLAADPLPADPVPGDELVIDGVVHRVISVVATYAGDRPVVFRLQVRR